MNETLNKLKFLIDKPVTIFTHNIGRIFTDVQYNDYFTGICTYVNNEIIETVHPITKCKNIFFISNIVGICEEQQLDPSNPEHQKMINEINNSSKKTEEDLSLDNSVNIDVDLLSKLVKN